MSGVLERTLGILELLAMNAEGMSLGSIAEQLNIPRSAAHRLLTDLCRCGYVRQSRDHGDYVLTTKLVAMGLSYLQSTGIVDVAQPLLDRVAAASGEFVRLSVIDGDRLTWVAKAQGARRGLRYDPEMGADAHLSCTASGHAWLMTLADEEALMLVAKQGFGRPEDFGPNAPTSPQALLSALHAARSRGFAITIETFTPGMSVMAAPVQRPGKPATGVISVAGPTFRFDEKTMITLAPVLLEAAAELASMAGASPFFSARKPVPGEPHMIVAG
jgi:IclR family acetate operon transcriptional repressor